MLSWELPQEEKDVNKPIVQPQKSWFGQVFDNLGSWKSAARADIGQIGLDTEIKDTYDAIMQDKYKSKEEYDYLQNKLRDLLSQQYDYQTAFKENQQALEGNNSQLADFTQIGGTVHGIYTQGADTVKGAALGAATYGLPALAAGGVGAIPAAIAGAAQGATWGNRVGAFH